MFYNTNGTNGAGLLIATKKAQTQQEVILDFFLVHPNSLFTPAQVWQMLKNNYLLTSVRRCMSDLTKSGDLIKTDTLCEGSYGSINYTWMLNQEKHPKQLKLF